jgi:hypothetical protein
MRISNNYESASAEVTEVGCQRSVAERALYGNGGSCNDTADDYHDNDDDGDDAIDTDDDGDNCDNSNVNNDNVHVTTDYS